MIVGILKGVTNNKSRIAIILVFAVLALFMSVGTYYGTKTLSSVRAYISGEGRWTKAQKDATTSLMEYAVYQEPEYYQKFNEHLKLQHGFSRARQTLMSDDPDIEVAKEGFQTGITRDVDINLLIWGTLIFKDLDRFQRAIDIWREGDQYIGKLEKVGTELHKEISSGKVDMAETERYMKNITSIDHQLTELESAFSETMGKIADWVRWVIFWVVTAFGGILLLIGFLVVNSFFGEVNKLNEQLTKSDAKYKKVLQNSRDVIYELDFETGKYNYISPYAERMLGYPVGRYKEEGRSFVLDRVHPEDLKRMEEEVKEMRGKEVEEHFSSETEFRIKTAGGNYIWVNNQRSLIRDREGNPTAIVGSVRNISDRKRHEVQVETSLKEKQTLLEEVHHRVKNNLAVISSLLELQKSESDDSLKEVFEDTQSRIRSIAMIHEKLYQTETLSAIDIREYIDDFTNIIGNTFNSQQRNITITNNVESLVLEITRAVPLGLIANELLNNAFKHGFEGLQEGEIIIGLESKNGEVNFSIADNGRPLPDDFSFDSSGSLGMTLIKTLARQLEGKITVEQNEWKKFEITFPS